MINNLEKQISAFPIRLEEVIGTKTIKEFADSIDVSEGAVRKWLKGPSKPRFDIVVKICAIYNYEIKWLSTGEGIKNNLPNADEYRSVDDLNEDYALIDGYDINVSTGHGTLPEDIQVKRRLAFRYKWLNFRTLNPASLVVVFAKGDSMEPTIHNSNSLLVNIEDTHLTDGSIFVLRFGDELYAKRLQKRFDGSVELISDNKEYKDQLVDKKDINELKIIGKVVWVGKDLY